MTYVKALCIRIILYNSYKITAILRNIFQYFAPKSFNIMSKIFTSPARVTKFIIELPTTF